MVDIDKRHLRQLAVLWALATDSDGEPLHDADGKQQVAAATEINCQWEEDLSSSIDAETSTQVATAVVFVDREISEGSILRLGAQADLPATLNKLREVVNYVEVPDVKGNHPVRKVTLRNFRGTIATIAS